jgi:Flp pilus assembly protein TadG
MSGSSRRATDPRRRSRRQRGQSVVELALGLPLMLALLFGTFNIGILIVDKVAVAYAARQGARLAAVLGNGQAARLTTLQIDQNVCQAVLASSSGLVYGSITEVDVYQADAAGAASNGSFNPGVNPYDSYDGACNQRSQAFAASARVQTPPNEVSIGVWIKWQYATPAGLQAVSLTLTEYCAMKTSPALS